MKIYKVKERWTTYYKDTTPVKITTMSETFFSTKTKAMNFAQRLAADSYEKEGEKDTRDGLHVRTYEKMDGKQYLCYEVETTNEYCESLDKNILYLDKDWEIEEIDVL